LASRHVKSGLLRRFVLLVAEAIVVFYLILDAIFAPIFRPLLRWIIKLRYIVRLQEMVAALPPYGVLVALAVPFAFAEPAKVIALYLLAAGHLVAGVALTAIAHLVTLVIVERIYHAGREKLRTILWFARLMDWLTAIRDHLLAWVRSTRVWAFFVKLAPRLRAIIAKVKFRFRTRHVL
jgi:hypothetical protein